MSKREVRQAQAEFIRKYGSNKAIIDVFAEDGVIHVLLDRPVDELPPAVEGVGIETRVVGSPTQYTE